MQRRATIAMTGFVLVALALAGCVDQSPAVPTPSSPATTTVPVETPSTSPSPTPTPTPPPPAPQPGPLDSAAVIDAAIAKDAAALVGLLGDPIRAIDTIAGTDALESAGAAESSLTIILTNGETFKPGQDGDYATIAASTHPEFGTTEAVVIVGSQGTLLSFLPGAYLRTATA